MGRKMEAVPVPRSYPAKASAIRRLEPAILLIYVNKGNKFLNLPHFDGMVPGHSNNVIAIRGIQ